MFITRIVIKLFINFRSLIEDMNRFSISSWFNFNLFSDIIRGNRVLMVLKSNH